MPRGWITFIGLSLVLVAGGAAWSQTAGKSDPTAAFDQANKLYEEGKFPAAIAGYQKLQQEGHVSAALFFNLGNAFFKSGQTGRAIFSYRLAESLAPRDPDIRANLQFARKSVGGDQVAGIGQRWFTMLTLNELTAATAISFWAWLMVLALGQFRPATASSLRLVRRSVGGALVFCGLWLGFVLHDRLGSVAAVVTVPEASVRYGPLEESQNFFTVRNGAELRVLGRKENWLQVTDQANHVGWLREKEVVVLPQGV